MSMAEQSSGSSSETQASNEGIMSSCGTLNQTENRHTHSKWY